MGMPRGSPVARRLSRRLACPSRPRSLPAVVGLPEKLVDIGIIAPLLGLVVAAIVVVVLVRVIRSRAAKAARREAEASEGPSESDYLDSSHIISRTVGPKNSDRR